MTVPCRMVLLFAVVLFAAGPFPSDAADGPRTDCLADAGPCVKVRDGIVFSLEIVPRPVEPMRELTFSVSLSERNAPYRDAAVAIDLSMPGMFMGRNLVFLSSRGGGVYEGKGVIVRCPTGERLWMATVTVQRSGRRVDAPFLFEVR